MNKYMFSNRSLYSKRILFPNTVLKKGEEAG